MADNIRLPIKVVGSSKKDFRVPEHNFGSVKVFEEVTPQIRMKFSRQLTKVEQHFKKSITEYPDIPAVARVILKKKALAKSYRPSVLFSSKTCPILGCGKFRELLISVTRKGLVDLDNKILRGHHKTTIANISTIEKIEPYTAKDAIGTVGIESLQRNLASRKGELRIRLFIHQLKEINDQIARNFINKTAKLGLPEPQEIFYSKELKIFKLENVGSAHVEELANFVGTQNVSTFPSFDFFRPASIPIQKAEPSHFRKPDPKINYPIVGIVDTGTNPNDTILEEWIAKRHNYVPTKDAAYNHGSAVAAIAIYGRYLNGDDRFPDCPVKFVDVAAIPKTGKITEYDLLTILEEVLPKHPEVRFWNLSINNTSCFVDDDTFSFFATALDRLQDQYNVTFVISAGNYESQPLRQWPPNNLGEADRIFQPAESVRGFAVGSIAHLDRPGTVVQREEPSPFSRRGPGAAFLPKPDLTHYGGNCKPDFDYTQVGVRSLDGNGQIAEWIGTSFSTPLVTSILANIKSSIKDNTTPCLIRALAVHSAVLKYNGLTPEELRYRGFGIPGELTSILTCSPWEATLIFEPELRAGFHFEKFPFPFPPCLFKGSDKVTGEVIMTLAYDPPIDPNSGSEYCRVNVDASLGTCEISDDTKPHKHKVQIHPEPKNKDLSALYEDYQIKHGFKWSPLKVYRRYMPKGVTGKTWNLRLSMLSRSNYTVVAPQKVALIVTMRDPHRKFPVYDETINLMRNIGWITQDLQVEERIRIRP